MNNNSNPESYRYIVFISNENVGYYDTYYDEKPHNRINDMIGIFKSEDKAKDMCKGRDDLDYVKVIWED